MNAELFNQGCTIMFLGMGIVFLFLVIMIFAMQIMTKILGFINKFMPEVIVEKQSKKQLKKINDSEIALAIALAAKHGGKI